MKESVNYGIVYVLTNPAMPGLVKIGMTSRDEIEIRMRELFNTGVPVPFECEYGCRVAANDCRKVEKALHKAFKRDRIHPDREFFKIDPDQAIAILELLDQRDVITQEIQDEINNDLTGTDIAAGEKLKRKRRPNLDFMEMGISLGSKIYYGNDENALEAEVISGRKVLFNGKERSLSSIERELRGLDYNVRPSHWYFNNKLINDIYEETYPFEEEMD